MSMPFTTPEQVQKSVDFLASVQKPACPNCSYGIRMCHHTPCLGTVEDIERLMDAGYSKNLMLDWWIGADKADNTAKKFTSNPSSSERIAGRNNPFNEDVPYLVPAIKGREGDSAPFARTGSCTMLINNQCSLHDIGLKPTQGQYACCKVDRVYKDAQGDQLELDERIPILHTWNTQRGKDLIERWKREVNFNGKDECTPPENLFDLFDLLLAAVSGPEEARKRANVPEPTEEERNSPRVTQVYDITY